ncbi:hypothetical protein Pmani_014230 [Petrolisthes manimaculis]|uniref:Single domain-containing protein n=1 Tax=Petrolisthes manimaculis TaxID=1843537 RepID=A0AAE1UCV5_9EUCA|nr:hypothetical protein Pmani_014230 [Petrolisthes manimaculis]
MKVVVILLVSVLGMMTSLHLTNAALQNEMATDPDFPGLCLGRLTGTILAEGSKKALPNCQEVTCFKQDDGEMILQTTSCGAVAAGRGCKLIEDSTLNYPGCCPRITCD